MEFIHHTHIVQIVDHLLWVIGNYKCLQLINSRLSSTTVRRKIIVHVQCRQIMNDIIVVLDIV